MLQTSASNHFQSPNLQQQHEQQQSQFRSLLQNNGNQNNVNQNQGQNLNSNNSNGINSQPKSFQPGLTKVRNEVPMVSTSSTTQIHQPILMRHPQADVSDMKSVQLDGNGGGDEGRERSNSTMVHPEDKKLLKRAANRRSAQLSRKRKKQFIETLKEENADLRRMELILRSIPDLVVSFDSSGKIGFVSQSVSKFLSFTPEELEGKSFWDRLCEDSVRLLKAAFMDALAARENESTSTPLGSGVWELRLQDKNNENIMVTLNGVVHFTGDAPECVCSIRLCDNGQSPTSVDQTVSESTMKPDILPQQSVFNNGSGTTRHRKQESVQAPAKSAEGENRGVKRNAAQISDVDSSSAGD